MTGDTHHTERIISLLSQIGHIGCCDKCCKFGAEYEQLRGWSPDGTSLFHSVHTADGNMLRSLDISSGSTRDLFDIGIAGRFASVSLDDRKVAYFKAITDTVSGIRSTSF